jgi:hypothetical protein
VNVELAHLFGTGSSGSVTERWCVVALPDDNGTSTLLREPLLEIMRRAAPVREITIHETGSTPIAFSANVSAGRLSNIMWYSLAAMPSETESPNHNEVQDDEALLKPRR